jgi:hypothetical protein
LIEINPDDLARLFGLTLQMSKARSLSGLIEIKVETAALVRMNSEG